MAGVTQKERETRAAHAQRAQEMPLAPVDNLPAPRPRAAVQPIVPANWQEITAIASAICRANMAPKSYCKTDAYGKMVYVDGKPVPEPEKVAIAIMHGMEVGMTPMTSLQSLAVINGMPSVYGDGLVALVRASGWLEDLQEGIETDEQGKPQIAWCKVKRKGEASWKERELTYVECVRAGWTNKDGPWKLTPGRMMTVRVRGWLLRDMFADVLRGLHSAEEMEDMVDVTQQEAATTSGPAPAEPKRSDEKYQQSSGGTPHNDTPSGAGQGAARDSAPAGGDQDGASGQPGPSSNTAPASTKAPKAPSKGGKATGEPQVTDVVDQNEGVETDSNSTQEQPGEEIDTEIKFTRFKTQGEFYSFSDHFLQEASTTPAQARAWRRFYAEGIDKALASDKEQTRIDMNDTLTLYLKKVGTAADPAKEREPGEEG